MSSFRQPGSGLSGTAVLPAVVAAVGGWLARSAQVSKIRNHERITDALAPVGVDPTALGQILVDPPPSAGALGTDASFADDFRHIDNAPILPAVDAGECAAADDLLQADRW
jgi:hypothetical protein